MRCPAEMGAVGAAGFDGEAAGGLGDGWEGGVDSVVAVFVVVQDRAGDGRVGFALGEGEGEGQDGCEGDSGEEFHIRS